MPAEVKAPVRSLIFRRHLIGAATDPNAEYLGVTGPGGGSASSIYSTGALAQPIVVAGGGGGAQLVRLLRCD